MAIEILDDSVRNGYDTDACKSSALALALVLQKDRILFK